MKALGRIIEVKLKRVRPFAGQPREYFDQAALRDLARSIKVAGLQNPIQVRRITGDLKHDFELVDGQRRWHACQMAGLSVAPTHLREDIANADDQFLASVVSNFAREGHTPVEVGRAAKRLRKHPAIANLERGAQDQAIADMFGRSVSWVLIMESMLRLHPTVQRLMSPSTPSENRLSWQTARELVTLSEKMQVEIATKSSKRALGWKGTRILVRQLVAAAGIKKTYSENRPHRTREKFFGHISTLRGTTEALLEMTVQDFQRIFFGQPRSEQQAALTRIEDCLENLEELRDAVAGMLKRQEKAA